MNTNRISVAAVYCVYHDDIWLPYSVRSIYDDVDQINFLVSSRPWNGPVSDNHSTLECIEALPDPAGKIKIHRGHWRDQVSQRNYGLAMLQLAGFDYCLVIDADEVYDEGALKRIREHVSGHPQIDVWHSMSLTYWKSLGYRIDPPEDFNMPILIRVGSCGFYEFRNPMARRHHLIPPQLSFVHHLSYARPDALIHRKISSVSAASQISRDWFETVWKAWDTNKRLTDLHPINPGQYKRAVPISPSARARILAELPEMPWLQKPSLERLIERSTPEDALAATFSTGLPGENSLSSTWRVEPERE